MLHGEPSHAFAPSQHDIGQADGDTERVCRPHRGKLGSSIEREARGDRLRPDEQRDSAVDCGRAGRREGGSGEVAENRGLTQGLTPTDP